MPAWNLGLRGLTGYRITAHLYASIPMRSYPLSHATRVADNSYDGP